MEELNANQICDLLTVTANDCFPRLDLKFVVTSDGHGVMAFIDLNNFCVSVSISFVEFAECGSIASNILKLVKAKVSDALMRTRNEIDKLFEGGR
jgi:hypothetical protein